MGTIVVYREKTNSELEGLTPYSILIDQVEHKSLENGKSVELNVTAGTHSLFVQLPDVKFFKPKSESVSIKVDDGQTVYLQCGPKFYTGSSYFSRFVYRLVYYKSYLYLSKLSEKPSQTFWDNRVSGEHSSN